MEFDKLTRIDPENKEYLQVSIIEHPEILDGYLLYNGETYKVSETVIDSVCKQSGISNTVNKILRMKDKDVWKETVLSLYKYYYPEGNASLLIDEGSVEYISFKKYQPLLNKEFLTKTYSSLTDYTDILYMDMFSYDIHSTKSEVLIFSSRTFEYNSEKYQFGILLSNDELNAVSCTYAVKYEGITFYLPSKYCNLSSARYARTTSSSMEAYELLLLKIVSDMSSDSWFYLIPEISSNIKNCKIISITYEEYRRASRMLNRTAVLSDIDESEVSEILEDLDKEFIDFQENYPSLEDKKSSYIWRCSALGENSIYKLISVINEIVRNYQYYPESLFDIRQTIGELVMLNKISQDLAKKRER